MNWIPLAETIRKAEQSHTGMSYADQKHPNPYRQGYVRGWGDCLAIFKRLLEAQRAIAEAMRADGSEGAQLPERGAAKP